MKRPPFKRVVFGALLMVLFCCCSTQQNRITVRGRAYNSKAGAIVDSKEGAYFIDTLEQWPKKFYGRKMVVKGQLFIYHDTISSQDFPNQTCEVMNIIKSPRYRFSLWGLRQKEFKQ